MNIQAAKATAENYSLLHKPTGTHIRIATRVRFENGEMVEFMDRIPKKEAIRQARMVLLRENDGGQQC